MARFDELINNFAPGGVEFKRLGEVGTFIRGNGLQKKDLLESGVPAIHYGQLHTVYGAWTTTAISHVTPEYAARLRSAEPGDLVIATTSENDEAVAKATAWLGAVPAAVGGDAYIYRHRLEPKYVAYFFQSGQFQKAKRVGITGTKVRRISGDSLARLDIPVPPREVQREIARILDAFTELEAELEAEVEAELEARRRQYIHYRDALLSFAGERVKWAAVREVGSIYGGLTGKSKQDFTEGNAPFVTYMNVFSNLSTDIAPSAFVKVGRSERQTAVARGDVLFTASSESRSEVGMASAVTKEPAQPTYLNSFCFGFRPNSTSELDPEFAKHLFRSRVMRDQIVKTANGVTRINISKGPFEKMIVPLPDVEEQRRIAQVLDKFVVLVDELSSGLPAEIEARREQYAYYRDRLLTFQEAPA